MKARPMRVAASKEEAPDTGLLLKVLSDFKKGDFTTRMPSYQPGMVGKVYDTLNEVIEMNQRMAAELDRLGRVVGKDGRIKQRASLPAANGGWAECIESVNTLVADLVQPTTAVGRVIGAVAKGDLTQSMTLEIEGRPLTGEFLRTARIVNTMVDQLSTFAAEVTRVAREVGTAGKLGGRAEVKGVAGTWKDLTDNVNNMASNLTAQVRNIAEVTTAVARGDLSKKITVDVRGEILELKNTINTMVDQLSTFASEVTRVAREVGTEGRLGGQAEVKGVGGTWKDLTDNVNFMAANLTSQVRNIAEVTTAVANGDLSKKITVDVKGEILELKNTINTMVDQLNSFASEVTRMAREVGIDGKLGGQASVPGAAGTWKDLTGNVNRMAVALTTQVRAIAEVAKAVTKGDLSRSIAVDAAGEVAALKDNINEMIRNLRQTTEKNTAQDWLKTNLAKFTRLLQGQRDLFAVSKLILSELAPLVSMQHGVFYINESPDDDPSLKLLASYAYRERRHISNHFRAGEGLIGQCALEKDRILLTEVPADYIQITSGLGAARPLNIVILPVLFEGQVKAVIELASFHRFSDIHLTFIDQLTESIGIVINTITATMRTEELLKQSQNLANELQTRQAELTETNRRLQEQAKSLQESEERLRQQQEELQQTNEELEEKANLLAKQNLEVERKNREIEQASLALQDKAEQLSQTSRYKSEFLANMSHELRTPLNSMLILSKLLSDASEGLSEKQREFARTIHDAGSDLLDLINEILDLSKIESGMMPVELSRTGFNDIAEHVRSAFNPIAKEKGLEFLIHVSPDLPGGIYTDRKRLQQILKNLLSNAFKFTEHGLVNLRISVADEGWSVDHSTLNKAGTVIAFAVSDTGVGIPPEQHNVIFEAFQQADGTTNRKHGGTGLGLSISREIASLLGGEIRLVSSPGAGSTFTLYLPITYIPQPGKARRRAYAGPAVEDLAQNIHSDVENLIDANEADDDRASIQSGDLTLLIIENDTAFARVLMEAARQHGFKVLAALSGEAGLSLAGEYRPSGIILDIELPGMDGWTVLDRLKHQPGTRHIPVHIISASKERRRGLRMGAMAYDVKPVTLDGLHDALNRIDVFIRKNVRHLLVVEADPARRDSIAELVGNGDVETIAAGTAQDALAELSRKRYDCLVVDLELPDMNSFELIERVKSEIGDIPIIVYTGNEQTAEKELKSRRLTETAIVKEVGSLERLLDETALFLHRAVENLPEKKRLLLERLHKSDPILAGKKVLIIDDDMRNIFALTSLLERHQMQVAYVENGTDGIEALKDTPDVDIVLVDIMMPEMDGYQTMREIRAMPQFARLPLIALTAKAMKGDREKCIEAGASDYIMKPADSEQLLSLLRVWLYK